MVFKMLSMKPNFQNWTSTIKYFEKRHWVVSVFLVELEVHTCAMIGERSVVVDGVLRHYKTISNIPILSISDVWNNHRGGITFSWNYGVLLPIEVPFTRHTFVDCVGPIIPVKWGKFTIVFGWSWIPPDEIIFQSVLADNFQINQSIRFSIFWS